MKIHPYNSIFDTNCNIFHPSIKTIKPFLLFIGNLHETNLVKENPVVFSLIVHKYVLPKILRFHINFKYFLSSSKNGLGN